MYRVTCRRWTCRRCGELRAKELAWRTKQADPNRLITLTVNPAHYLTPRDAYDDTRRAIADLSKKIRKEHGEFEYVRVLEVTAKGWPHYHFVARCVYLQQRWLSDAWARMTGAPIVDIRKIKKKDNVVRYIIKYLSKCQYIEWTNRRVAWSRNFFPEHAKPDAQKPTLTRTFFSQDPPERLMGDEFYGSLAEPIGPNAWAIYSLKNPACDRLLSRAQLQAYRNKVEARRRSADLKARDDDVPW